MGGDKRREFRGPWVAQGCEVESMGGPHRQARIDIAGGKEECSPLCAVAAACLWEERPPWCAIFPGATACACFCREPPDGARTATVACGSCPHTLGASPPPVVSWPAWPAPPRPVSLRRSVRGGARDVCCVCRQRIACSIVVVVSF